MLKPQDPAASSGDDRIETARLILRRPVYADGPALHELLSDPELCRFTPAPASESLAITHFTIVEWHEARERGIRTYVGALRSDPRTAIGFVQIGEEGDVGGLLAPKYAREGYATEAMNAALSALAVQNPWTVVDAEHEALIAMLESAGFRRGEILPAHRVHPQISAEPRDCLMLRRTGA